MPGARACQDLRQWSPAGRGTMKQLHLAGSALLLAALSRHIPVLEWPTPAERTSPQAGYG